MEISLTDFVQRFLSVLGIAGDELIDYTNKILLTAAGKVALALNLSDQERLALEREIEAASNAREAFGSLDRVLGDGRHVALFGEKVAESLMELADSMKADLDEATMQRLASVVDEFAG